MSGLGTASAQAIALINHLRDVGADLDLDLPRIVFAGKQSAGKSSLVEALTGICLPRAHRTCTRCPIEVTTKRSTSKDIPWSCDISLRILYDRDNDISTANPPSVRHIRTVSEAERAHVAKYIREAQDCILAVQFDDTSSLNSSAVSGKKQLFTRNIVSVQITGSECEDLALVDLPGLIQSQEEKENEVYIGLVESLVKDYLSRRNTVIVSCIASDEDIENQKIYKLARDVDPEGLRTIGVLTKPDKIERGTEGDIISILKGDIYSLKEGFYAVRSPNKEELDQISSTDKRPQGSFQEGRDIEANFFISNDMGSLLHAAAPERCGSRNLLRQLSHMLKTLIDEQVPDMMAEVTKLVERTSAELEGLGKKVSKQDSRRVLNDFIREFASTAGDVIRSAGNRRSFWHSCRTIFENARAEIQNAAPSFDVGGKLAFCDMLEFVADGEKAEYLKEPITMTVSKSDATEIKRVNSPLQRIGGVGWSLQFRPGLNGTSVCLYAHELPPGAKSVNVKYKIIPSGFASAATREHHSLNCCTESVERLITSHVGNKSLKPTGNVQIEVYVSILGYNAFQIADVEGPASVQNVECTSVHVIKPYSISDVKEYIAKSTRREIKLPGPASYATSEDLIKGSVSKWKVPAYSCAGDVHDSLLNALVGSSPDSVLNATIPAQFPRLRKAIHQLVEDHMMGLKEKTLCRINELLEMEKTLYTSNNDDLSENRRKFQYLIRSLDAANGIESKVSALSPSDQNQLSSILMKLGCSKDDLTLIPTNNALNEEAVDVMAGGLSYFTVKSKVFSDTLHQHIIYHLIDQYLKDCADVLIQGTGAMSETNSKLIHKIFQEDEVVERKRTKLEHDVLRQRKCQSLINEYDKA